MIGGLLCAIGRHQWWRRQADGGWLTGVARVKVASRSFGFPVVTPIHLPKPVEERRVVAVCGRCPAKRYGSA